MVPAWRGFVLAASCPVVSLGVHVNDQAPTGTFARIWEDAAAEESQITGKSLENHALLDESTDEENTGRGECKEYFEKTGCSWTLDYSCPGQSLGAKGDAANDESEGFKCCCLKEGFRQEMKEAKWYGPPEAPSGDTPGPRCAAKDVDKNACAMGAGDQDQMLCEARGCCWGAQPSDSNVPSCFQARSLDKAPEDGGRPLIPLLPTNEDELQKVKSEGAAGVFASCWQLNCKFFDLECLKYEHKANAKDLNCESYQCTDRDFDTCCELIVTTTTTTPEPPPPPPPPPPPHKKKGNWWDIF